MPSIHTVKFPAFRGLRNVELNDCADVNLLVGANNSGKTTVLEALALLCRPDDIAWWIDTIWPREIKGARTPEREVMKFLFPHEGTPEELFTGVLKLEAMIRVGAEEKWAVEAGAGEHRLEMKAQFQEAKLATRDLDYYRTLRSDGSKPQPPLEFKGGETKTSTAAELSISGTVREFTSGIRYQVSEDGALPYPPGDSRLRLPCAFVSMAAHRTESLADRLGAAFLKNLRPQLTELLKRLQPTLETFEAIPKDGQSPQVWLKDSSAGWLPLSVAGDGLRRAFHLAVSAASAERGVLLIDEIETALHTKALRKVFGFLVRECKALGVQIFATTHSLEALDAILEESVEDKDTIAAFILSKDAPIRRIDGEQLRSIRMEFGYDIR